MSLMFQPLRRYADFQGRASRSEFWLFFLFCVMVSALAGILSGGSMAWWTWGLGWGRHHGFHHWGGPFSGVFALAHAIFTLYVFIPSLAVTVRRLHDSGKSAWWLLLVLIPAAGQLVLLIFMLLPSEAAVNRFGPPPLETDEPSPAA